MEYVRFGSTGLKVSPLCLGCMTYGSPSWRPWVLPEDASRPFIRQALDLGINFFDTADMYSLGGSEEILGRAIRDFVPRDDVVLATKVFYPMSAKPNDRGLSRKHILASIDASLARLLPMLDPGPFGLDLSAVRHVAHTLRSSSASVGAVRLATLCTDCELALKRGAGADELAAPLTLLRAEMQRIQDGVQQQLAAETAT